jgi:hypothetical protein
MKEYFAQKTKTDYRSRLEISHITARNFIKKFRGALWLAVTGGGERQPGFAR